MFSNQKQIGPFMGVSCEHSRTYKNGITLRFIIYSAYNAFGLIGPESNGIAVLCENDKAVVCDEIEKQSSGYYGPSKSQVETLKTMLDMSWDQVTKFINAQHRARYPL